jgi:hypothetical protein
LWFWLPRHPSMRIVSPSTETLPQNCAFGHATSAFAFGKRRSYHGRSSSSSGFSSAV